MARAVLRIKSQVSQLMASLNSADHRMKEAIEHDERKVDKTLIKNLLLGYLSSTTSDKSSILRVFANVLDFTELEKDKTGLNNATGQNSRLLRVNKDASSKVHKILLRPVLQYIVCRSLIQSGPDQWSHQGPISQLRHTTYCEEQALSDRKSLDQEASLSTAFVRFLESESKPKPQLPALPIVNSSQAGNAKQQPSQLLLPNVTLPTFPDFVPARNTGSILKEVLKDS